MSTKNGTYYLPSYSPLPLAISFGLFCILLGAVNLLHDNSNVGILSIALGVLTMASIMFFWFRRVIIEDHAGVYNEQADRSFRWGMFWFIFSEVMFFSAFFGALFYTRLISVPELGGVPGLGTGSTLTNLLLWPNFKAAWPLFNNPNPAHFVGPKGVLNTWEIPALNTLILLTSGATVTWAHWALKKEKRRQLIVGLALTFLLGILFLSMQSREYFEAYTVYGLKLNSGIYGTTFFMLTGFHAMHVTIGTIMLIVIWLRCLKGHFTPHNHFAFEGVAWYWHFVDVVWLFLFIFVYWL